MKALLLTNEFPPSVYGGAGMHVAELTAALRGKVELDIRAFGTQDESAPGWRVRGYGPPPLPPLDDARLRPAWEAVGRDLAMAADPVDADLVHCHTWYSHLGGLLVRHAYGIPLVVTVHSLEPLRPWKREQLGGAYDLSSWVERTALESAEAVIAVSDGTRDDILRLFSVAPERVAVIHNGIDTAFFAPDAATYALTAHGVNPAQPYVLFVGRITRQKGLIHLLHAIRHLDPGIGVVMAAGQPDTPELAAEVAAGVAEAQQARPGVVWIPEMLSREAARQLFSHAAVFACPSVYEPFGITNLEAMACQTPVVASAVGGIPEVVVDGQTGLLVPLELSATEPMAPADPDRFARGLAAAVNTLVADPALAAAMGAAGRRRAVEQFGWPSIADRTLELYRRLAR